MAKGHRWLFERREKDGTRRYYLRARVPQDLIHVLGRREIKRSLGTADRREALERIDLAAAEVGEVFAEARRRLSARRVSDLTETEVRRMAFLWFRRQDGETADADFRARGEDAQTALDNAGFDEAVLASGSDVAEAAVQATADESLLAGGWPPKTQAGPMGRRVLEADVDKASEQYHLLCQYVRRGMLESSRRSQDRLRGWAARGADPMFAADPSDGVAAGPSLTWVLDAWLAERRPPEKTAQQWRTAVRRFTEVSGDLPVDAITKAHVREFKDTLLRLPAVLPHRLRRMPLPGVVSATRGDGRPRLSPGAVGKQLAAIRSLLSWSASNGYVEANVAAGVGVAGARNADEGRLPYDADDMRLIFADIARFRETHPSRFWLPLMAAFTGARLGELGQLTVGDVRHRDGVDYLDINTEGEGKSVKTRSSVRLVPVHPELVRCGFLRYVEERRTAGGGPLFPDLRPDSLGKVTGRFSKWWTRYRRGLGVGDPRKPFHALRHTFKEACRAAGVEEEVHDAITGHSGGGVGRGYGRVPLAAKARAMELVGYEVDLSNLGVEGRGHEVGPRSRRGRG